jgi:hypothetical protein
MVNAEPAIHDAFVTRYLYSMLFMRIDAMYVTSGGQPSSRF